QFAQIIVSALFLLLPATQEWGEERGEGHPTSLLSPALSSMRWRRGGFFSCGLAALGLFMVSLRRPGAGKRAGQMAFPGNRAGVRHHTVKDPAETDQHKQRDNRRPPTLHQKASYDEVGNQSE